MPANAPERGLTSRSADVNVQSGRFATVRLLQVLMIAALVLPLLCRGGRGRRQDPGGPPRRVPRCCSRRADASAE
jgi:hypothetical protein